MPRPERAWRAFRALSWPERALALRAWLLFPAVAVGLRLFGFRRLRAWAAGTPEAALRTDVVAATSVARLVSGAAAWATPRPRCLARSLVLGRLLRQAGLTADLRLGVDRASAGFAAHAWVEHAGVALGESEDVATRYAAFDGPLDVRTLNS
jgi:hypothetical protein